MRNLRRNLEPVFYKNFIGQREIIDQYGNSTGSYEPIYSELKVAEMCVSPNIGASEVEMFGTSLDYDRTATTADIYCDMDENSVAWLDGVDTNEPWNYQVAARAPWKNSVSYALSEVNVSVPNVIVNDPNNDPNGNGTVGGTP